MGTGNSTGCRREDAYLLSLGLPQDGADRELFFKNEVKEEIIPDG
jgi:hypothetical protein